MEYKYKLSKLKCSFSPLFSEEGGVCCALAYGSGEELLSHENLNALTPEPYLAPAYPHPWAHAWQLAEAE